MPTNRDFLRVAREWIGTPYHHQQAVKGHGCDCAQLVAGVAQELGVVPEQGPAFRDYGTLPRPRLIEARLREFCEEIPLAEALPGDILYLWWTRGIGQHLAILTDLHGRGILHATRGEGRVIETALVDSMWRCVKSAWRVRGVETEL